MHDISRVVVTGVGAGCLIMVGQLLGHLGCDRLEGRIERVELDAACAQLRLRDKPRDGIEIGADHIRAKACGFGEERATAHEWVVDADIVDRDVAGVPGPQGVGISRRDGIDRAGQRRLIGAVKRYLPPLAVDCGRVRIGDESVQGDRPSDTAEAAGPPFVHRVDRPVVALCASLPLSYRRDTLDGKAAFERSPARRRIIGGRHR